MISTTPTSPKSPRPQRRNSQTFSIPSNRFRCDSDYEEASDKSYCLFKVLPNRARALLFQLVPNLPCNNDRYRACVRLLAMWGSWVRTLSAILLTIAMGLPMAAPLFASGETALPICCRRNGKHHCMAKMSHAMDLGTTPTVSLPQTKCPQFPKMLGVTSHGRLGFSTSTAVFAGIVSHPALSPQTQSNYRVSLLRSHQKRGPPPSFALC